MHTNKYCPVGVIKVTVKTTVETRWIWLILWKNQERLHRGDAS